MMNTFIEKRKRAISHSTMKSNNRNIIQCCNNIHQGAPRTGKQTRAYASDLGDGSHVTCRPIRNLMLVSTYFIDDVRSLGNVYRPRRNKLNVTLNWYRLIVLIN